MELWLLKDCHSMRVWVSVLVSPADKLNGKSGRTQETKGKPIVIIPPKLPSPHNLRCAAQIDQLSSITHYRDKGALRAGHQSEKLGKETGDKNRY